MVSLFLERLSLALQKERLDNGVLGNFFVPSEIQRK
jgi:hypothetical protein